MEKNKTKDKIMNSIFESILAHFEEAKFNIYTRDFKKILTTIIQRNPSKHQKLICESIEYYFDGYSVRNLPYHPHPFQWQKFLTVLQNRLVELDNGQLQTIYKYLFTFQQHVETLDSNISSAEDINNWYQKHCKNIHKCTKIIRKRLESADNIYDHVLQLETLTLLIKKLFDYELINQKILSESRKFIQKNFIHIFGAMKNFIQANVSRKQNPRFIQWMDNVLDGISDLKKSKNYDNIQDIKISVEEVLCHALSIAQICDEEYFKKIKSATYTILQELKQIEIGIKKSVPNATFMNLHIDIISEILCILEKRVIDAVIEIFLKVFSVPNEPLEKLFNACKGTKTDDGNRSQDDLQELIKEVDFHVNSLTQVGLFAISCCKNPIAIAKINSYLASVESLESELVPSLISLYLEPSDIKLCFADFFVNHWIREVKKLQSELILIINPHVFCQPTLEFESENNLNTKIISFYNNNLAILTAVVNENTNPMRITKKIAMEKIIHDLKYVTQEVIVRANEIDDYEAREIRVYKILLDLATHSERIVESLSTGQKTNAETSATCEVITRVNKRDDYGARKEVYKKLLIFANLAKRAVKSLSTGHKTNAETSDYHLEEESAVIGEVVPANLDLLQFRGLEILKNRSILYKTPLPIETPNSFTKNKSRRRLSGVSFIRKDVNELRDPRYRCITLHI